MRLAIRSSGSRGGLSSNPFSFRSIIRGKARNTAPVKFIHRMCIGSKGRRSAKRGINGASNIAPIINMACPPLVGSVYRIILRMFSKMCLPSSTADTMLAKLSSARTISEASLLTSVPVIPMAIPMSAAFNAGASFTPSPVTATMCPLLCNCVTILNLCSGATRAYTETSSTTSYSSSSLIPDSSSPVNTLSSSLPIPNSLAIAFAVWAWSPVIITTLMPAVLHLATASITSSLGGSIIPWNPRKVSCSKSSALSDVFSLDTILYAMPSTLRAPLAISSAAFSISSLLRGSIPPLINWLWHILKILSGEPFT